MAGERREKREGSWVLDGITTSLPTLVPPPDLLFQECIGLRWLLYKIPPSVLALNPRNSPAILSQVQNGFSRRR